ncbi:hypothetical protein HZC31_08475 [Candidatus Woesearchaeota archaeon]|nr:hypothetical protein [Candidatus Woesearchaeota archaeon]
MTLYEQIHDWHVSLAIPSQAREVLKADFERWLLGEVPYSMMLGHLNSLPLETRLSTDTSLLHQTWEDHVERVKDETLRNPMADKALAEHCLYGSTTEIPPNPFVTLASYLRRHPSDVYDRVVVEATGRKYRSRLDGTTIEGAGFFWGIDPRTYWLDPDKNRFFAGGNNPCVQVTFRINLETRISYIDARNREP